MPYENALGDDINSLDTIERLFARKGSGVEWPAGILLETIQGEGGINAASKEWLLGVQEIARKYGSFLIVDDIQAGVGRSGSFFSFEESGITPDIVTVAKSISGFGLPMALVLIHPDHDIWEPAEHNGTFRGNGHAMVTSTVMLEKFWSNSNFQADVSKKSTILKKRLNEIATQIPKSKVKGRGFMMGIEFQDGEIAGRVCEICFKNGLIIETSGPDDEVVKFLAPLTTGNDDLLEGLDTLEHAVKSVTAEHALVA